MQVWLAVCVTDFCALVYFFRKKKKRKREKKKAIKAGSRARALYRRGTGRATARQQTQQPVSPASSSSSNAHFSLSSLSLCGSALASFHFWQVNTAAATLPSLSLSFTCAILFTALCLGRPNVCSKHKWNLGGKRIWESGCRLFSD